MKKVYVYGNSMVEQDSLAVEVAKKLEKEIKNTQFIYLDPAEEIRGKDVVVLDVAYGIKKVSLIKNLDRLETGKKVSLHDFDAAMSLKLMKKIGIIRGITILAIPMGYNKEKACAEVRRYLHFTLRK